jgi:phosphoribosylaminoimidazole-succinocarboxamide synthase
MAIKTLEMMYEGKAKQVFATSEPDIVMVHYRDDATAGDGEKKGTIEGKGIVNNRMSNAIMKKLTSAGIPTHYLEELNDRDTLVKRVEIIPLEVIIRNIAAGSFSKRLGIEEGTRLVCPTLEFSYKNDDLHDPLINSYYALALGLATKEEINKIKDYAFRVNEKLTAIMDQVNITLVDFKIEFGRTVDGSVILADEISPDTCRFWDKTTGERLDKDLFRRGLGGESEAYQEVMSRILG